MHDTRLRRSLSAFLGNMRDRNLSQTYIACTKRTLRQFMGYCELHGVMAPTRITSDILRGFLDRYQGQASGSQHQHWMHLRGYLIWAELPLGLKFEYKLKGMGRYKVDWLSPEQVERVLTTKMTLREAILVCGHFLEGARPIELLRLTVKDARVALQTGQLRLFGKNRERYVKLKSEYRTVLEKYLMLTDKPENERLLGISYPRAWELVRRVSERSGVKFSGYTGRRTFARCLMLNGVQLPKIQRLLGHANINTTISYLGINFEDLDGAMDTIKVPPMRTYVELPAN